MSWIPATNFVGTLLVNVDNDKLSDAEFREFVRNTLPSVECATKCRCGKGGRRRWLDEDEKGYFCDDCWQKEMLSLMNPVPKSAIGRCVDHYPARKIYRWVGISCFNKEDPAKYKERRRLVCAPGGSAILEGDMWR